MKKILILAMVLALAVNAMATIRYVSAAGAGAYTTINAAASAAVSGDTILIGPGSYAAVQINEVNKRLTVIGAGWDQTFITMSAGNTWFANGAGATRSSYEGFRYTIGNGTSLFTIANSADSITYRRIFFNPLGDAIDANGGRGITVEDCIFNHTPNAGFPIEVTNGNYPTTIRNCVFVNQGNNASRRAIGGVSTSGTVEVYNSVFLNWQIPFSLSTAGGPLIAVNNMFYDWMASPSFGSYNSLSTFDYNASQTIAAPGTNGLSITTNPFVNYNTTNNYEIGITDLHLDPTNGATFVNTGHPSLLDFTDGSRSDFGIYGGPKPLVDNGVPNYPWAVNISTTPNLVGVGTPVNANATGRVGPAY